MRGEVWQPLALGAALIAACRAVCWLVALGVGAL